MVNKRLQRAKLEHQRWLEKRGLTSSDVSRFLNKNGRPKTMPDLSVKSSVKPSNGFAPVIGIRTPMENRFKERPEVRAEIEKKAMRISTLYNKGNSQYVTDGDLHKYEAKARK